jgi:hypothetical protein
MALPHRSDPIHAGELHQTVGNTGVIGAQCGLTDRQPAFQEGFGLGIPTSIAVHGAQFHNAIGYGQIICPECRLTNLQSLKMLRLGLLIVASPLVHHTQLVQAPGNLGMARPQGGLVLG